MSLNKYINNKINYQDCYFGTVVNDEYRWLEDSLSSDTKKWIDEQNQITEKYFSKIDNYNDIKNIVTNAFDYEKIGIPLCIGGYKYYLKNKGLEQHHILYRQDKDEIEEVFLNPNEFSEDGSISLSTYKFSKDGSLCAYLISEGGSDWNKLVIIDTNTKEQIDETLVDVKFSNIAWQGNEGIYYSSYGSPYGSYLSDKTDRHLLFFHKLGSVQKDDKLVFGDKQKYRYINADIIDEYLVISAANNTTENNLYFKKIGDNIICSMITNHNAFFHLIDINNNVAYVLTNLNASNNRLISVPLDSLEDKYWQDIITENENVLFVSKGCGYLFAHYLCNVASQLKQYDYQGKFIRNIEIDIIGTVSGFSGEFIDKNIYYSVSNYITPTTIYSFDVNTGESSLFFKPKTNIKLDDFQMEQVFYVSEDNTKIPMYIMYKNDIDFNGKNPTILYGYGGFGVKLTPIFSPKIISWVSLGGVYAIPNIRGGGEYGDKWHNLGRRFNKKNVFIDFMYAAYYLFEKKYTSSKYLALNGGSNGGLLVAATMLMNLKIAKVIIPQVGVLDMLRYHQFTSGAGWSYDYGRADENENMFLYLKSYSPLHNIYYKEKYPATLILTADHDDRVVPAHSFKFVAKLQKAQDGNSPILIKISKKVGHSSGKNTKMLINEITDIFSFILKNTTNLV